jgi:uncharacterized Zn-finger protein
MVQTQKKDEVIAITEKDLPLHCPTPNTPVWSMHPRVFLDIVALGSLRCPYCGQMYEYKGKPPAGH